MPFFNASEHLAAIFVDKSKMEKKKLISKEMKYTITA